MVPSDFVQTYEGDSTPSFKSLNAAEHVNISLVVGVPEMTAGESIVGIELSTMTDVIIESVSPCTSSTVAVQFTESPGETTYSFNCNVSPLPRTVALPSVHS